MNGESRPDTAMPASAATSPTTTQAATEYATARPRPLNRSIANARAVFGL